MRTRDCANAQAATTSMWTQLKSITLTQRPLTLSQVSAVEIKCCSHSSCHSVCTQFVYFLSLEQERFDKDFAVADQKVRQQQFQHVQDRWAHLREERYTREVNRFENMET